MALSFFPSLLIGLEDIDLDRDDNRAGSDGVALSQTRQSNFNHFLFTSHLK